MKSYKYIPLKAIIIFTACAAFISSCNLTDVFTDACSTPALEVTKTEDTNDGVCSTNDCSLREAVITANSCTGTQTIQIPAGTYTLTLTGADEESAATGDLDLTDNTVIQGEGNTIIDGNATDRIFDVKQGKQVTISNLTLQNGQTPLFGSAIANMGNLTVDRVIIQNNHQTDKTGNGGAFFSYELGSSLDITNSAVVNNWAAIDAAGLYNVTGTMNIENVTISGNHGYGVANAQGGQTSIKFSTIADDFGLYEIWNPGVGNAVQISNSIISGRTTEGNCFQPIGSGGHNIDSAVGGTANTCGLDGSNDLINTDPKLLELSANGGNTLTRALDATSPAIDSADTAACNSADQRGVTRPQGAQCDRGAFELQNPPAKVAPTPTAIKTRPPENTPTPVVRTNSGHSGVTLITNANANCRKGPGTGYTYVTSFKPGTDVDIVGQNMQKTWVLVEGPASKMTCWMSLELGTLNGSLSDITIYPTPPLPSAPTVFGDSSECGSDQRTVRLTWTLTLNADGYRIYRNGELLATVNLVSFYEDTTSPTKDFIYEIEAFNQYGVSERLSTQVQACP
jgi:CSLREA domain-containing protein